MKGTKVTASELRDLYDGLKLNKVGDDKALNSLLRPNLISTGRSSHARLSLLIWFQVNQYSHVLTGYVANVDFLRELALIIGDLKSQNPGAVYCELLLMSTLPQDVSGPLSENVSRLMIRMYKAIIFRSFTVCDPVLGDNGAYYVPKELTEEYRKLLLPLCDILTPNHFELGELTGIAVTNEIDLLRVRILSS